MTKIVNGLLLLGAEVIYESMYDVHVSGHACQEEQKLMQIGRASCRERV